MKGKNSRSMLAPGRPTPVMMQITTTSQDPRKTFVPMKSKFHLASSREQVGSSDVMPSAPEPALKAFLETWEPAHPVNPRAAMESSS